MEPECDAGGQLRTSAEKNGSTVVRSTFQLYDAVGRLRMRAVPEGTLQYLYTNQRNLLVTTRAYGQAYTGLTAANLATTAAPTGTKAVDNLYAWDFAGRLINVINNIGTTATTTYSYTSGRLSSVAYPTTSSFSESYGYDARGALSTLTVNWPGSPTARAFKSGAYTRTPSGMRSLTRELYTGSTDPERDFQHVYDSQDRLISENFSTSTTYGSDGVVYQYDDAHNRKSKAVSGSTSTFNSLRGSAQNVTVDARDEWSTFTDGGSSGTGVWDNRGNLTSWTVGGTATTYTYDRRNRLVAKPSGTAVTQVYDAEGNRVSKTVGGTTTWYLIDPQALNGYPQVVVEYPGSSTTPRTYLHGLRLIAEKSSAGTVAYYVHDVLGNIRGKLDTTGAPVTGSSLTYDAYGNVEGAIPGGTSYGYTGEVWDNDLGALNLRARWYLPRYGIFSQKDSLEGYLENPISQNHIQYANSDPINGVDPSGNVVGGMSEQNAVQGIQQTFLNGQNSLVVNRVWVTAVREIARAEVKEAIKINIGQRALDTAGGIAMSILGVEVMLSPVLLDDEDGTQRILYRGMSGSGSPDLLPDGEVLKGTYLGIRPKDIPDIVDGLVKPTFQGLSVTPNNPSKLPPFALKKLAKGEIKVWAITEQMFDVKLGYVPDPTDPEGHGYVRPKILLPVGEYKRLIKESQMRWVSLQP
ncbi:MAG TPA: RHS repeat-associated core domain-containing protein [Candidatus Limnocylindria bacterium]|jgi:RHS repeat-associated protein|nr:RHS repeat-associated core domain-containing protein [Candidatus Limnocylindria bacterium]